MANATRDQNYKPVVLGVSSVDLTTPTRIAANPSTGALLIDGPSLYTGLDTRYLKLDASNDPITGDLSINANLILGNTNQIQLKSTAGVASRVLDMDSGNNVNFNRNSLGNALQFFGTTITLYDQSVNSIASFAAGVSGGTTLYSTATTSKALIVKGFASQSANLTEWQNSSGTVLSVVDENGYFGIGTSNPQVRLSIKPTVSNAAIINALRINNDGTGTNTGTSIMMGYGDGSVTTTFSGMSGYFDGTGPALGLFTGSSNTRRITILSTGEVGVGTSSPLVRLHVSNGSNTLSAGANSTLFVDSGVGLYNAEFKGSGTYTGFLVTNTSGSGVPFVQLYNTSLNKLWTTQLEINKSFAIREGNAIGTERLVIIEGGNIGIGTTSPNSKLHVTGTADDQQLIVQANATQTANLTEWQNSSGTVKAAVDGSGNLSLHGAAPDSTIIFNGNNSDTFNSASLVRGMSFETKNSGAGSIWAVTANATSSYVGTVGSLKSYQTSIRTLNASTVVTNTYGLEVQTPTITAGAITNSYGIYIQDHSNASTLNYAIYTNAGRVRFGGALELPYVAKTTTYTITADDYTVDCTSGTFTVTLPTAVSITGRIYNIKNSGSGTITVDTTSSQTIDGLTSQTISAASNMQVQSTGSNWIIL